jgi:Mrp family chromosome partitioning ATPase
MTECSHDCARCAQNCADRTQESVLACLNPKASVQKSIAVVSGKGGVGKSLVTALLASAVQRAQKQSAVLDADITGPSVPKIFGVNQRAQGNDDGIFPAVSKTGVQIMSVNLLLENATDPVIWRGPILAGTVKQFWSEVLWNNVDLMFLDMPPGTGDVALTVFQSLPIDGIVVVTSPQELVSMIVEKAVKMADMMKVPVLGLVENMSYFECPSCHEKHFIYGKSHLEEEAEKYKIAQTLRLPTDSRLAALCDEGRIEEYRNQDVEEFTEKLFVS